MSIPGMNVGATGMLASTQRLDVVANNIANTNTAGFKRNDTAFSDVFYQRIRAPDQSAESSAGLGVATGQGVVVAGTPLDLNQGPLVTGLDLDIAISGKGFFRVRDDDGNLFYTRYGAFLPKTDGAGGPLHLDLAGKSYVLDPEIELPGIAGEITVQEDGQVFQGNVFAGQITLFDFRNPNGLLQSGNLLFQLSNSSGPPISSTPGSDSFGITVGGRLEGSNVDVAAELVQLIEASRQFELSSQSFRTGDAELSEVIRLARSG